MTQTTEPVRATGGCLCGAVKYEILGSLRPVVYCHCNQCRRTSGHFVAATATLKENLALISDECLEWVPVFGICQTGLLQALWFEFILVSCIE